MGKNYMARVLLTLFMGWLVALQAIANHTMKVEASNEVSTLAVLAKRAALWHEKCRFCAHGYGENV